MSTGNRMFCKAFSVSWWELSKDGKDVVGSQLAHIASTLESAVDWIKANEGWPPTEFNGLWFVEDYYIDEYQTDRLDGPDYRYYTFYGKPCDERGNVEKEKEQEEDDSFVDEIGAKIDSIAHELLNIKDALRNRGK